MKSLKLILISAASLLVYQLGWAQSAPVPTAIPGEKTVAETAAAAAKAGTALPVIPRDLTLPGTARPTIWVSRQLVNPASPPFSPPGTPPYIPKDLVTAYGVNKIVGANGGAGITIAIVDAFYYAGAEADLNTFSSLLGLPPCTTANGCFKQVAQDCTSPPGGPGDSGWEVETMLDIEWAHSVAPNAKILLVEATDDFDTNLFAAVQCAATYADIISNSWSGDEDPGQTSWDTVLAGLGKPILASSGDAGAPAGYPCTSPYVTCIGGTSLYLNASSQRTGETGWGGSGGSCSAIEPLPHWQAINGVLLCDPYRAAPDVAADADPHTGVAVYDSGNGGWYKVGGTSVSSPVMAGIFADIMAARVSFSKSKFAFMNNTLYNGTIRNYPYFYFDVTLGFNGYSAGPGYDLVTGLGVSTGPAMANRFFGLVYP